MIAFSERAIESLTNPVRRMFSDSPASGTPVPPTRSVALRNGAATQSTKPSRAAAPSACRTASGGAGKAPSTAAAAPPTTAAAAAPPAATATPPAGAAAAPGATTAPAAADILDGEVERFLIREAGDGGLRLLGSAAGACPASRAPNKVRHQGRTASVAPPALDHAPMWHGRARSWLPGSRGDQRRGQCTPVLSDHRRRVDGRVHRAELTAE